MLLLILDSKTAILGAAAGTELCVRTLIPSIFPFLVASAMLTGALSGQALPFLGIMGRVCGIPQGAEFILVIGLLGGYPVGAQCVAQSWKSGVLPKEDAQRMLAFCSNAGPSFLFGIVGSMFSDGKIVWILWGIHIISAMAVGAIIGGNPTQQVRCIPAAPIGLSEAVERSARTMGRICGWVILFRLVLAFLEKWAFWIFPTALRVLAAGLLELSNGCILLEQIESDGMRFIIAGMILALGGLCVAMQTVSVTQGLSLRYYLPGKLLQCCFSVILCGGFQFLFPQVQQFTKPAVLVGSVLVASILILHLRGMKKSSSNPALCGV